jgi:hypothetical protein
MERLGWTFGPSRKGTHGQEVPLLGVVDVLIIFFGIYLILHSSEYRLSSIK